MDLHAREGSRSGWCSDPGQTRTNPGKPDPDPDQQTQRDLAVAWQWSILALAVDPVSKGIRNASKSHWLNG